MSMKRVTINDEIKRIGIRFIGHYNKTEIKVEGTNWHIIVPPNRVRAFCKLFPDVDWENGQYIHTLKGRYVRVTFDEDSKIYSIQHIVKDLEYYVDHPEVD